IALPHPRLERAMDHRHQRLLGLYPHAQRGRHRPLWPRSRRHQGRRALIAITSANKNGRPWGGHSLFGSGAALRVIAAVVVIAVTVGVEVHGVLIVVLVLIGVLLTIDRGLVERACARAAVRAANVIDTGVAGERAVGLIAPGAARALLGVAKGLVM